MQDDKIHNDKSKFLSSYSKLANELDNFTALSKLNKPVRNQIENKLNFLSKENRTNFQLTERLKNNKQEAKYILTGKKSNLGNNIFNEEFKKSDKLKNLKNSIAEIKPINYSNNKNDNNGKNLYEKVRSNLNEMRRQFNLEETFQKNNNLLEFKVISPRNNMIYTNKNNTIITNRKNCLSAKKEMKNYKNIFMDKDYKRLFNKLQDPLQVKNFNDFNKANRFNPKRIGKDKFDFFYENINNDIENDNINNNNNNFNNFNNFNNSEK